MYLYLLKRYLLLKYPSDSDLKYSKLMSILGDIQELGRVHRHIAGQRDPKQLGPLLTEVFCNQIVV